MWLPISPSTSPAIINTTITAARSRFRRLAPTAAAATAALPIVGTPAQEAISARNRRTYPHQLLARLADAESEAMRCTHPTIVARYPG